MTPESLVAAIITALLSYDEPARVPTVKPARPKPAAKPKPRKTRKIDKPSIKNVERTVDPMANPMVEELLVSAKEGIRGEPIDTSDLDMLVQSLRAQTPSTNTYNKDDDAEQSNTWLRTQ